jgi:uncharacterized protein DUF5985
MRLVPFLQGAVAMGCGAAGLFFLKFWRQGRDRLFLQFALAFWMLAMSYVTLTLLSSASDWGVSVFVLRLFAFCLILYGIFDKNRRP